MSPEQSRTGIFSPPEFWIIDPEPGSTIFSKHQREWGRDYFPRNLSPDSPTHEKIEFFSGRDVALAEKVVLPAYVYGEEQKPTFVNLVVTPSHLPLDWDRATYNLGTAPNQDTLDAFRNIAWSGRSRFAQLGCFIVPLPFHDVDNRDASTAYRQLSQAKLDESVLIPAAAFNLAPRPHVLEADTGVGVFYRRTPPLSGENLAHTLISGEIEFVGQYGQDYCLVTAGDVPVDLADPYSVKQAVALKVRVQKDHWYVEPNQDPIVLDLHQDNRRGPSAYLQPLTENARTSFCVGTTVPIRVNNRWLIIDTGYTANPGGATHLNSPLIRPGSSWLDNDGNHSGIKLEWLLVHGPGNNNEKLADHVDFFVCPPRAEVEKIVLPS